MTFIEVLSWMRERGCHTLVWPTLMMDGCVSAMSYERVELRLRFEERTGRSDAQQYFIEIARTRGGAPAAFVYTYPKPASLEGDVHVALEDGTTCIQPERRKENVLDAYSGWHEPPEFCWSLLPATDETAVRLRALLANVTLAAASSVPVGPGVQEAMTAERALWGCAVDTIAIGEESDDPRELGLQRGRCWELVATVTIRDQRAGSVLGESTLRLDSLDGRKLPQGLIRCMEECEQTIGAPRLDTDVRLVDENLQAELLDVRDRLRAGRALGACDLLDRILRGDDATIRPRELAHVLVEVGYLLPRKTQL